MYVGTEHLALAMVASEDPTLADVFRRAGVDPDELRRLTNELLGSPLPGFVTDRGIAARELTMRSKSVIDEAMLECAQSGRDAITPLDLLLGLLREGEGVGAEVLRRLGVDLQRVRTLLGESDAP